MIKAAICTCTIIVWKFQLKGIHVKCFHSEYYFLPMTQTENVWYIKFADRIFPPKKTIAPIPLQVKWMFHK